MRRTLAGMVVAAAVALVPLGAMAGNQEFAEEIAASLRDSGQLQDYKIGVKFQDGTVWLRGRVADREQMNAALKHVLKTPGVLRVVNNLEVVGEEAAEPSSAGLRQASSAIGAESASHLSAADLSSRAGAASETAARLQQASAEGQRRWNMPIRDALEPASAEQPASATPTRAPLPAGAAVAMMQANGAPVPMGAAPMPAGGAPIPQYITPMNSGMPPAQYDQPNMPNYAWPGYAAYPNYAAVTYPKVYSPTAWPYIGPFYPYPQVPLGWRKVTLEWHDGWWQLDFDDYPRSQWFSGLFRAPK